MPDNMPGGLVGFHNWHYHPVFQPFGNTAGTYAYISVDSGGLLKIRMISIQNNRIWLAESIPENLLVYRVPNFAFLREAFDQAIVFEIIIDLKMRRLVHLKFEV